MPVALATVLHDPAGLLLDKIVDVAPRLAASFGGIAVVASAEARDDAIAALAAVGAEVVRERAPAGFETVGRRRRRALAVACSTGATHVLSSDLDHVMRWQERHEADLAAALGAAATADLVVIGRDDGAFGRTPAPLRETEALVNRFYEARTGRRWDLLMAVRLLSAPVAERIVRGCDEDTIATDVAWPLFAEGEGASLAYRTVPVDYETDGWYATGVSERAVIEGDPRAWAFRFDVGRTMFEAFERWMPPAMRG